MRITVAVLCVAALAWFARAPVAERLRAAESGGVRAVVAAETPAAEAPVEVTGTVREEDEAESDGRALVGADISVYAITFLPPPWKTGFLRGTTSRAGALDPDPAVPDRVIARTSTDAEGRFRLALRRGTRCAVLAEAGDRVGVHHLEVAEPREMALRVSPLVEKRVRVESARGEPLAGARLFVFEVGVLEPPRARFETDRNGTATLALAESDALRVLALGFAARTVRNALEAPERIVLHPARYVAGTVRDSVGRPIAGARVRIGQKADETRSLRTINEFPRHHALSDSRGRFRVEGLLPQKCDVLVDKPGFLEARVQIWPDEPDAPFVLTRPGAVEGAVVFPDGRPAPRARVQSRRADERGRFRIEGLRPGHGTFVAELDGHAGAFTIEIAEGRTTRDLRIVLAPVPEGSCVRYRLLGFDGTPLHKDWRRRAGPAGAFVRFWRAPPGTPVSFRVGGRIGTQVETTTVAAGDPGELLIRLPESVSVDVVALGPAAAEFEVHGNAWAGSVRGNRLSMAVDPRGTFGIEVTAPGYVPVRATDLRLPKDGRPIELRLVRADCSATGELVGEGPMWIRGQFATPRFRLEDLGPGPFTGIVMDTSRVPRLRLRATLRPGRTHDFGAIRVPPLRRVRGVVRDADGVPVWQASVAIAGPYSLRPRDRERRTRGDGSFEFDVGPFAELYLVVQKGGLASALVEIADEPQVTLGRAYRATVHLPAGVRRAAPLLTRADGRSWRPRYRRTGDVIELYNLPAGRFRFEVNTFKTEIMASPR